MRRYFGRLLIAAAALLLAACGGGSSGGSASGGAANSARTGFFLLAYAGGAVPDVNHAWVTVKKVALHADDNQPWSPTDTSWEVITLATPVTIDLAAAGDVLVGKENNYAGVALPVGAYKQIRLFLAGHDESLVATNVKDSNGAAVSLTFNNQLDYKNGTSVPIEVPNQQMGLKLDRGVIIASNAKSVLTTHMGVDRTVVRFAADDTVDAVTLRPRTFTFAGGTSTSTIKGAIDPAYICGTGAAATAGRSASGSTTSTLCASDITVSAHAVLPVSSSSGSTSCTTPTGARYESVQSVVVKPTTTVTTTSTNSMGVPIVTTTTTDDGSFELGPFDPTGCNPSQYDVVIRGKNMQTVVVKSVTMENLFATYLGRSFDITSGSTTTTYSTAIRPVIQTNTRTVNLASGSALPKYSGRVGLGFKLASAQNTTALYEAHSVNTDPFTGLPTSGSTLTLPDGPIQVATFTSLTGEDTSSLTATDRASRVFTNESPVETDGVFSAFALGSFYTDATVSASAYTSGATYTVITPTSKSGVSTGTVDVTITGLAAAAGTGVNKAQLIVSDVGGVVLTQDLAANLSSSTATITVTLPQGTSANATATGVYEFAVRLWNSASPKAVSVSGGTMKWVRSSSFVNLRTATTGTVTIAVP